MKKWNTPVVIDLDIDETAESIFWKPTKDGGYLGDGKLNGRWGTPANGGNNNGGNNNGGDNGDNGGDVVDPITVNS